MRLLSVLYALMLTVSVSAMHVKPVDNSQFEVKRIVTESVLDTGDVDLMKVYFSKRGESSSTIDAILRTVNKSGIIFLVLDAFVGKPTRILNLANDTAGLIELGSSINISLSLLEKIASSLNITKLLGIVEDSGLVTSILDGILLDDDYRPVLVNLTYRIVNSNKAALLYIIDTVFESNSKSKRDNDYSGTLVDFVLNIASGFLNSNLFYDIVAEGANSLNNTGIAVYTIKRLLANESYQNLTFEFALDLYDTGALSFNLSSIDIAGLANSVLSDSSSISNLLDSVLNGNLTAGLGGSLSKYAGALGAIVTDLQSTGLFQELNDYIFPSSSTSSSPSNTAKNKKEAGSTLATSVSATVSSSSRASSSSHNAAPAANGGMRKAFFVMQSIGLGGLLLML